jgi:hypothetical protein
MQNAAGKARSAIALAAARAKFLRVGRRYFTDDCEYTPASLELQHSRAEAGKSSPHNPEMEKFQLQKEKRYRSRNFGHSYYTVWYFAVNSSGR